MTQQKRLRKSEIGEQESMVSWNSTVQVFRGIGGDHLCQKLWRGHIQWVQRSKKENMLQSYLIPLWSLHDHREKDKTECEAIAILLKAYSYGKLSCVFVNRKADLSCLLPLPGMAFASSLTLLGTLLWYLPSTYLPNCCLPVQAIRPLITGLADTHLCLPKIYHYALDKVRPHDIYYWKAEGRERNGCGRRERGRERDRIEVGREGRWKNRFVQ